jgi:hypothetical protein
MSLVQQAILDAKRITSDVKGFGTQIILTAPTSETATIIGRHVKHHLGIDTDGNMVNSKTASITFSESVLAGLNYPLRNAGGEVNLKGHKVQVIDSTGTNCTYKCRQWFPDETIGLIVVVLDSFA